MGQMSRPKRERGQEVSLEAAAKALTRASAISAEFRKRRGLELAYAGAYQRLVKLGKVPQLRKKYRPS